VITAEMRAQLRRLVLVEGSCIEADEAGPPSRPKTAT